ncbi:MAG: N-methyl-L-tryptophan oxidase [Bacteroidetes bacterium]|nr:MAG: N-methyl-L-tryptophan oxidase [Bacteroidota bacterium]
MFDVIVIGVGSMGSSACYYLAKKGHKVLGLEQFDIPHERGSHAGQSRIIRKAYFEHPDYVPLLNRAYENWKELETDAQARLYHQTGIAYFGLPGSDIIKGVKLSASLYDIPVESLQPHVIRDRYSMFKLPQGFEALFEADAGFITPEKAVRLYKGQAIKNGAEIHTGEKVIKWKNEGRYIEVITDKNNYHCQKIIITTGAWAGKIIPGFDDKIKVTRQFMAWIKPEKESDFTPANFPCWMIADENKPGCYYGFPFLSSPEFGEPKGLKLAYHYPGKITDPNRVNRETVAGDMETLNYFLYKYLVCGFEKLSEKTCLYANSPDENFIIDKLEENVVIACGFSGHGFKFVSVVGEILADLATKGTTDQPIGFLRASRFEN